MNSMYDLGGSWYIKGEFDNIEANIITKEMITKKILDKYEKNLAYCNLDEEDLIGKYYDTKGNIYFKEGRYYQFDLCIKEFAKK